MTFKNWKKYIPVIFRTRGSVAFVIWPKVLLGVLYSVAIVCFHKYSGYPFPAFPITFIPVLGLVIGLLLVFRTTTGYDRYYEGRKLWSDMLYRIRVLARCTWLGVADEGQPEMLIEKKTAMNLLVAFAYATKNYLREEYSYDEDPQISNSTSHLPRIQEEKKNIKKSASSTSTVNTDTDRMSVLGSNVQLFSKSVSLELPQFGDRQAAKGNEALQRVTMSVRRNMKKAHSIDGDLDRRESVIQAYDEVAPTNIPMELVYYYQTWMYKVMKEQKVDAATGAVILNFSNELMNILAQLERILKTPIPLAYSIHLQQMVWLYLLTLPYQIVEKLGWITVPGMALAYFALLGILAIGGEIENPFGYDDNDLPLDEFCDVIQHEVAKFSKQKFPHPHTWIFNRENTPFGKQSHLSSVDLKGMEESQFHSHFSNLFRMDEEQKKEAEKEQEKAKTKKEEAEKEEQGSKKANEKIIEEHEGERFTEASSCASTES